MLELKFKIKRILNFNIIIKLRKGATHVAPFFFIQNFVNLNQYIQLLLLLYLPKLLLLEDIYAYKLEQIYL